MTSGKKVKIWLFGIAAIAFLLRIAGISYGIPQQFIGDEFVQVAVALKMLDTRSLAPNFPDIFYHQPLSAYISTAGIGAYLAAQLALGRFQNLAEMKTHYILHSGELLIVPRFIAAFLGALTSLLLYAIGKNLWNERAGLIAAWFGATDFLRVFVEHSGRVWGYMSFFVALAFLMSVKLLQSEKTKDYLKSAGATLLAAANLLPGLFTFVPAAVMKFRFKNKKIWLSFGVLLLGVIIIYLLSPRGLGALLFRFQSLSGGALVQEVAGKAIEYKVSTVSAPHRFFDAFATLFNYIPVYFLLAISALTGLWKENKKTFWFFGSFLLAYYLFIGPFFTFGWVARALVPLSVYLVVLAVYGIVKLNERFYFARKVGLAGMVAIVSLPSLGMSVWFDAKLLKGDTRTAAVDWIYENLPEDSKVLVFSFTNEVVNQNQEVLEVMRKTAPGELNTRQRLLLQSPDALYPRPKFFAWDLRDIGQEKVPPDFFKDQQFKYYLRTDFGGKDQGYYDQIIEDQFAEKKPLARFSPFHEGRGTTPENFGNVHNMTAPLRALREAEQFGPIVEIYEIQFR